MLLIILLLGICGGRTDLIKAQLIPLKNSCLLISTDPFKLPILFFGFFTKSFLIKSSTFTISSYSLLLLIPILGNFNGCFNIFINVFSLFSPLNGVFPYNISYKNIPNVHQSTPLPCPCPEITSGAKYSWVPTNDFDRAFIGSAINSGSGSNSSPSSPGP